MRDPVSTGLHPSAVVAQLAEKYGVTERALWSDRQRRDKWVPMLLSLEKYAEFAEMIEQKLNAVQKAAWSFRLKAGNESARVGALRTVLEALEIHRNIVQTRDVIERLYKLEEIAQKQKHIWHVFGMDYEAEKAKQEAIWAALQKKQKKKSTF